MKAITNFLVILIFTLVTLSFVNIAVAQDSLYFEDEGTSLWQEDQLRDDSGFDSDRLPLESLERDSLTDTLDESDGTEQYLDESEIQELVPQAEQSVRRRQSVAEALESEKDMLPLNIAYGTGTGFLIGAWFTLLYGGTAREKARNIGSGIVLGALLGLAVGTKSVYAPVASNYPIPDRIQKVEDFANYNLPTSSSSLSLRNMDIANISFQLNF